MSDVNAELKLRYGTVDDIPLLLSFIRSIAEFEKLTVTATEQSLKEALFGDAPAARALFAHVDKTPVAYAIYFFTFSSTIGKRGLWLDDLFVVPEFRGKGVGRALMAHLAETAIRERCGRFEWVVLDWNERAIRFYESIGADISCRIGASAACARHSCPASPAFPLVPAEITKHEDHRHRGA